MEKNGVRLNSIVTKLFSVIIALSFMTSFGAYALEKENGNNIERSEKITVEFIAEAECSIVADSNGESVILLTKDEALPAVRVNETQHVRTTVAILPSSDQEKEEIIQKIGEVTRGTGNYLEDGWFFGSSVYLSTTIYYTSFNEGDYLFVDINYVKIGCSTNSGTQITSMSLFLSQNGEAMSGYPNTKSQQKTFDATTARTIYAPSSWIAVRWDSINSEVGANLTATAKRSSGATSTFTLYNSLV
jgi:hypothetical protein